MGPCGISPSFPGLSPAQRQVAHVFLTRPPLGSAPEGAVLARLACVRHAASVRPEPGSNSPKEKFNTSSAHEHNHDCVRNSTFVDPRIRRSFRREAVPSEGATRTTRPRLSIIACPTVASGREQTFNMTHICFGVNPGLRPCIVGLKCAAQESNLEPWD